MPAAPRPQQRPAPARPATPAPKERLAALWTELKPHLHISLRMLRMERDAVHEAAADQGSLKIPAIMFCAAMLAFAVGSIPHWSFMVARPVMLVALMAAVHGLARTQAGTAGWRAMARVGAHLFVLEAIGIIPGMGLVLLLFGTPWYLWILVGAVEEVHGLDPTPSMKVVGLAAVALVALLFTGSIVDGAIRGASKDSSLAPGALAPERGSMKEINKD